MQIIDKNDLSEASLKLAMVIEGRFKNILQASNELGFTRSTIYSWIKKGKIPSMSKELIKARGFDPDTFEKKRKRK